MIFLSEGIICKGKRKSNFDFGIKIVELDDFEQEAASNIWKDTDVWTIKINGKDIDTCLTEVQL